MTLPKQTITDGTEFFNENSTCARTLPAHHCTVFKTTSQNETMPFLTQVRSDSEETKRGFDITFVETGLAQQTGPGSDEQGAFLRNQCHLSIQAMADGRNKAWRPRVPERRDSEELGVEDTTTVADLARSMSEENRKIATRLHHLSDVCEMFPDKDGDTLLHMAILHNMPAAHLAELVPLLGLGDQVNHRNHLHQSPLHFAVLTHHLPALSLLRRDLQASITLQDAHGNSPLHLACLHNDLRALKILCQTDVGEDLEPDLAVDDFEEVKKVEEEKEEEEEERRLWREMERRRRVEEVKWALEMRNGEGLTCLHLAVQNRDAELMAFLLQQGADVNAKEGKGGRTALHLAVDTPVPCINILTSLLLHPTLHLNAVNFAHQTALQLARGRGHLHLVNLLHAHGADWSEHCHSYHDFEEDDEDLVMMYDDLCIAGEPVPQT